MKKVMIFVTLFAVMFAFVGCGEDTTTVATTAATTEEATTTQAPTTTAEPLVLAERYVGTHDASAGPSGTMTYNYTMSFVEGVYLFHSEFVIGGELYTFIEKGTYTFDGATVTIDPADPLEGDPIPTATGTLAADGTLTMSIQPSSFAASRSEHDLTPAVLEAVYSGGHVKDSAMGGSFEYHYTFSFKYGEYVFYSEFESEGEYYSFSETGTYTVEGNVLTIDPADPAEGDPIDPVEGTINEDGTITISIQPSSYAPARESHDLAVGDVAMFYAGTHEKEVSMGATTSIFVYEYTMIFRQGTYVFHSEFAMGEDVYTYDEEGTYVVNGSVITMDPADPAEGDPIPAVDGTILPDGTVELSILPSSMAATRSMHELTVACPVVEEPEE